MYTTTFSLTSTFNPPALTVATIQWQNNQVNQITTLALTFTSAYEISAGSSIELTFPKLYELGGDIRHYFSGTSGTRSVPCVTASALTGAPTCAYTFASLILKATGGFPTKVNPGISVGINFNNVNTPYTCSPIVDSCLS